MKFLKPGDLLKDKKWRKALQQVDMATELSHAMVTLRFERGWSQKVLAQKIGTTQSGIARAENASYTPSVKFLTRIAEATNTRLRIKFEKF